MRELQFSNNELLIRKRHLKVRLIWNTSRSSLNRSQAITQSRELDMQSAITHYRRENEFIQRNKAETLASLDQHHQKELADLQVGFLPCYITNLTFSGRTRWRLVFKMHSARLRLNEML